MHKHQTEPKPKATGPSSPVITRWPLSSPRQIPGLFLVETLISIKPREVYVYCVLLSEYCGTICRPSYECHLHLTVLGLCLFCDYRNCSSTSQAPQFLIHWLFLIPPTFPGPMSNSRTFPGFPGRWPPWYDCSYVYIHMIVYTIQHRTVPLKLIITA